MARFSTSFAVDTRSLSFVNVHDLDLWWDWSEAGPTLLTVRTDDLLRSFKAGGAFTFGGDPDDDPPTGIAGSVTRMEYRLTSEDIDTEQWHTVHWEFEGIAADVGVLAAKPSSIASTLLAGDDTVTGSDARDVLYAFRGEDLLQGRGGNDLLHGGAGKDTLEGGSGNDAYVLQLGSGGVEDSVREAAGEGIDTVRLAGTWVGMGPLTVAVPTHVEHLDASGTGGSRINLVGSAAANTLTGSAGANVLGGGAGADFLRGGSGADLLRGGSGVDVLVGGDGSDVFDFNRVNELGVTRGSTDVIRDFSRAAGDRIDLSGIDARVATATDDGFTFIGARAFGANATGQLRHVYDSSSGTGMLLGSTDADAQAEFSICLQGVPALGSADLVL